MFALNQAQFFHNLYIIMTTIIALSITTIIFIPIIYHFYKWWTSTVFADEFPRGVIPSNDTEKRKKQTDGYVELNNTINEIREKLYFKPALKVTIVVPVFGKEHAFIATLSISDNELDPTQLDFYNNPEGLIGCEVYYHGKKFILERVVGVREASDEIDFYANYKSEAFFFPIS